MLLRVVSPTAPLNFSILRARPLLQGLYVLCATELWERYSYYAMRALLILFMKDVLLARGRWTEVFGMTALASAYGGGPDDDADEETRNKQVLAFASRIYGLYTAFVYFTPLFGVRRANAKNAPNLNRFNTPRRYTCVLVVHVDYYPRMTEPRRRRTQ